MACNRPSSSRSCGRRVEVAGNRDSIIASLYHRKFRNTEGGSETAQPGTAASHLVRRRGGNFRLQPEAL